MIDISREAIRPIRDITKFVNTPVCGLKLHYGTIHRWCTKGLRGIRLESLKVGGARYTSTEALQRFFAKLTSASNVDGLEVDPATNEDTASKYIHHRSRTESRINLILGRDSSVKGM